jgi:ABC-type transporter Mla maintaining outer membrane lipid asymmetry ATPase subunit MlaF
MMAPAKIQLTTLVKAFGSKKVLQGVDLSIPEGKSMRFTCALWRGQMIGLDLQQLIQLETGFGVRLRRTGVFIAKSFWPQ